MVTITINSSSLAHHLVIAAERYEDDAKACNEPGAVNDGGRLAEQFLRQAAEARAWAAAIQQAVQVCFGEEFFTVLHD